MISLALSYLSKMSVSLNYPSSSPKNVRFWAKNQHFDPFHTFSLLNFILSF